MTLPEVADFLDQNGHPDAAAFLRHRGGRDYTSYDLTGLKKNLDVADTFFISNPRCRIWSNERLAWWRAKGAGYTENELEAGWFSFKEAWDNSSHCAIEAGIVYEVFPDNDQV